MGGTPAGNAADGGREGNDRMSAPETRLIGDMAAEKFATQAAAVLSAPETMPALTELAAAVALLVRDRQARMELACGAPAPPRVK